MSDTAQGPGWWMATDGKFYPPELHPTHTATLLQDRPQPGTVTYANRPVFLDPVVGQPLAAWWKRLVAILIDGAIIGVGYYIVILVIGIATDAGAHKTTTHKPLHAGALIAGLILLTVMASIPAAIYYGIMNGSARGQTVGKMAMGIAVRDSRHLGKIGFWRAVGRYLMMVLFMIVLFIPYILDNLSPLWDKRRQAWHDKTAHSVVIDLRP
jgi:uncharacterized RDD family membrane protein YckC